MPPALDFDRGRHLERLATEHFDLLVVGGGVTGCGVALDAAARGLRTGLVEAEDWASGTSSKSSKLIHGGLRYLQQHEYRLVYEALAERQILLGNAPHLVHPLPFLIPLFGRDGVVNKGLAQAYSVALWLYDLAGGLRIGHRHQRIDATAALAHFPALRTDRLVASFLYWDAHADDARLTLALARTAAGRGAAVANYAPVSGLLGTVGTGRVRGARLADGTEVTADVVVNAGGVWSEHIAGLEGRDSPVAIRPAKGVHVSVPAERLPCTYASVLAVPGDKRAVFVVPWEGGGFTYIGTTDTDYDGPLDEPRCNADDVAYLLDAVNAWTTAALTPADVTGVWAGLRPLIRDEGDARTADLSRRHTVVSSPDGVVTVTGGKLTTYRRMAADTVDAAAVLLGRASGGRSLGGLGRLGFLGRAGRWGRSPTRRLPLWGAGGARSAETGSAETGSAETGSAETGSAETGSAEISEHLSRRYGEEAHAVLDLARDEPALAEPLVPGLPYLRAEAVFAARHEMVHTLTDVLARRTRALILDGAAAAACAPEVAALIGPELGWSEAAQARQVRQFVDLVAAERTAAGLPITGLPSHGVATGTPGRSTPIRP